VDRGAESGHIEVSVSDAVAVITLRRPRPPLAAAEQAMAAETEAASGPDAAETAAGEPTAES
jgi:hypothetical protein